MSDTMTGKIISNYPDYIVYENGTIWSNKTDKFLRPSKTERGYLSVELFKEGKGKRLLVHRIVATAFIPNPNNYPQVNHKDENPMNNDSSNLEWCTAKYNMNYGNGAKNRHSKIDYSKSVFKENARKNGAIMSKRILMYSKDGKFIKVFDSIKEAWRETGIFWTNISRSAHNNKLCAGGYIWRFEERSDDLSAYQF